MEEKILKEKKQNRRKKIILIAIIIILILMFYLLGYRVGKIGYESEEVSTDTDGKIKLIQVMQEDIEIIKDTQLDIFKNEKLGEKKIIAPGSNGKYIFCIENKIEDNVIYNIKFLDEMNNKINMKYKLKKDNEYIIGNEEKYVGIEELNVNEIIAAKDTINVFTLEWYWENDDENDTKLGINYEEEYYKLSLEVQATQYKE